MQTMARLKHCYHNFFSIQGCLTKGFSFPWIRSIRFVLTHSHFSTGYCLSQTSINLSCSLLNLKIWICVSHIFISTGDSAPCVLRRFCSVAWNFSSHRNRMCFPAEAERSPKFLLPRSALTAPMTGKMVIHVTLHQPERDVWFFRAFSSFKTEHLCYQCTLANLPSIPGRIVRSFRQVGHVPIRLC